MLSDAELVVVSRSGALPVMPAWAQLPAPERDLAAREAREALVGRGLLDPGGEGRTCLHPDLRAALVLREGARAVVAAHRVTAVGEDHWYAHLVEDVVLLEEVSAGGCHGFALGRRDDLEALLVAATLHPGAADGRPGKADPDDGVRVDLLVVVKESSPRQVSLVSGPRGTWRLTAGEPRALTVPGARQLLASQLPPSGEGRS